MFILCPTKTSLQCHSTNTIFWNSSSIEGQPLTVTLIYLITVSGGDWHGSDFDTVWEAPNISKSTFHAETALVAFDSQINTYTFYVFMPHEMYFFRYLGFSYYVKVSPHVKITPTYGTIILLAGLPKTILF